jgi:hypothetical protein
LLQVFLAVGKILTGHLRPIHAMGNPQVLYTEQRDNLGTPTIHQLTHCGTSKVKVIYMIKWSALLSFY